MYKTVKGGYELNSSQSIEDTSFDSSNISTEPILGKVTRDCDVIKEEEYRDDHVPGTSQSQALCNDSPPKKSNQTEVRADNVNTEPIAPTCTIKSAVNLTSFKMILFEQSLKGLVVVYLTIGFVSAAVYLGRQVVTDVDVANKTWTWIGLLNSLLCICASILALSYKLILQRNENYVKSRKPENAWFFYSIVLISATISWIHLLITELRNFQYFKLCDVYSDLVLPIAQMIFIMLTLMTISDLLFYEITSNASESFYVVYKSAAMLIFANSVNCLIFHLFEMEANYLQMYIIKYLNGSTDVYCYNHNITDNFIKLYKDTNPFLQVFTLMFFLSSIAIMVEPIQQFSKIKIDLSDETERLQISYASEQASVNKVSEYNITAIIGGVLLFMISVIGIPLDVTGISTGNNMTLAKTQITFNFFLMLLFIILTCLTIFLMKVLYDNFPMQIKQRISTVDFLIIWVCVCGQLIACSKTIINSSQFLGNDTYNIVQPTLNEWQLAVHILRIIAFCGDIVQSLLQAMALDLINNMKQNNPIRKETIVKISYPVIFLIASNIGLFINNGYTISGSSSFHSFSNKFNQILWDLLSCTSGSLVLIFRGYSVLFLLQFRRKLNSNDNSRYPR